MIFDFAVIGAGIAGTSVAAEIAATHKTILLEREDQPGYHTTGRSAAVFSEIYGNATIRALSRASRALLFSPPTGFTAELLVRKRQSLFIARKEQMERLAEFRRAPDVAMATRELTPAEALEICPLLRADYLAGAVLEPGAVDVEVHELHQAYLRQFRRRGGVLRNEADVRALRRTPEGWTIHVGDDEIRARVMVNAGGAWADSIGSLAGLAPLGIQPLRRTAVLVDAPTTHQIDEWPLVLDIDEQFYFKPDAGALMLSPADEEPSEPCDAQPEELDIAIAVDRICTATTLEVRRVRHSWAGLRTFAPDRTPVVGFDPADPAFFWLAGQGGYGIQTAPALARAAAALLRGEELPVDMQELGLRLQDMSPSRFGKQREQCDAVANA